MSKAINRLDKILDCIEDINFIINDSNLKITNYLYLKTLFKLLKKI